MRIARAANGRLICSFDLKVDDDVKRWVPQPADVGARVTIGSLLYHTSGYRDWPAALGLSGWRMDDVITTEQILSFVSRQHAEQSARHRALLFEYGVHAARRNRVTRAVKPFRAWMEENVFRPLGMTSTHFRDDPSRLIPNRASGYALGRDSAYRATPNAPAVPGSSSLFTTGRDQFRRMRSFASLRMTN